MRNEAILSRSRDKFSAEVHMTDQTKPRTASRGADQAALDPTPARVSLLVRCVTFLGILTPFLGLIAAPFIVWGWGFGWTDLGLLLGMYALTALGITVGFHRLFVHRSFETYLWVKFIFAVLGSMAVQGSLIQWVGLHRKQRTT
jgi:stearoyl-CoA desaturase (Delta-9 desaturase)